MTLHRDRDRNQNGGVSDVDKELAELAEIAKRVVRNEAAAKRDREEIRERLPALREAGVGPADLERAIQHVFVAGSISRWTKDYAKPDGKPGRPRAAAA
jgi:capsid portal protein